MMDAVTLPPSRLSPFLSTEQFVTSSEQRVTATGGESEEIVFFSGDVASQSYVGQEVVPSGDRIALDDVPDLSSAISPGVW